MLLTLHIAATLYLVGLIWFVQVVHYPLFHHVGRSTFVRYEAAHTFRTSLVVVVPMLVELVTAALLVVWTPAGVSPGETRLGLALVGVVWASTFLLQVPMHRALATGYDEGKATRLVRTNWLRTAAWTARGALCFWWLAAS